MSLRKFLRDVLVISVKLYSTSFMRFFSNYLHKNILTTLKYVVIGSVFEMN